MYEFFLKWLNVTVVCFSFHILSRHLRIIGLRIKLLHRFHCPLTFFFIYGSVVCFCECVLNFTSEVLTGALNLKKKCLYKKKKHTHLTFYQLHIYSLTASFSCKTNTRFLFYIFYILVFIKKKLPTCTALGLPGLVIALACVALLLVLITSIISLFASRFG